MFIQTMRRAIRLAIVVLFVPSVLPAQQETLDDAMWNLISESGNAEQVAAFIAGYPDSEHIDAANALFEKLQAKESQLKLEDTIFDTIGNVSYTSPLSFGNDHLIGLTLADLLETSPQYPPVEGLPDELWKEQSCQSCHQWTRETLCTQAETYVEMDPARYRGKNHPFGGLLKINLRNWAQHDCQ